MVRMNLWIKLIIVNFIDKMMMMIKIKYLLNTKSDVGIHSGGT